MLRLQESEVQNLVRRAAQDVLVRECTFDRLNAMERGEPVSAQLWGHLSALGWPGMLVPVEYGGVQSGFEDVATLCEEFGRNLAPGPFLSSSVIATLLLDEAGTAAQKDRLLPGMASGKHIVVPAITEERYGWEPGFVGLRGEDTGDGLLLSGVKQFIPDADVADTFICAARTGASDNDVAFVLVDARKEGVVLRRMPGWSSQPVFEVVLDRVIAGEDMIVGRPDAGWDVLAPVLDRAAILLSAYLNGAMERVYEMTLVYADARKQFGQSIARFQRVQDHLINMRNWTDASGTAVKEAVGVVVDGDGSVPRAASLAKLLSSRGFLRACDAAHHVHAGIGSDKRYGLHLFSKASRAYYHYLGSPEHHLDRLSTLLEF